MEKSSRISITFLYIFFVILIISLFLLLLSSNFTQTGFISNVIKPKPLPEVIGEIFPSSFFGDVEIDGKNIPLNSTVKAYVNGTERGTADVYLYKGNTWYTVDVNCELGDLITFKVNGLNASEKGTCSPGEDMILLNLSVTTPLPPTTTTTTTTVTVSITTTTTTIETGLYPNGTLQINQTNIKVGGSFSINVMGYDDIDISTLMAYFNGIWHSFSCNGTQKNCSQVWTHSENSSGYYYYYGYVYDNEGLGDYTNPSYINVHVYDTTTTTTTTTTTLQSNETSYNMTLLRNWNLISIPLNL